MSTPLSDILSLVAAHGKSQAAAFLQGEAVIAGSPDQEIWEHLARHDILWDGLTVADQDKIRDSYLEAFKIEAARRLTPSDPATSPLPVSVAQEMPLNPPKPDSDAMAVAMAIMMMQNLRSDCLANRLLKPDQMAVGLEHHINALRRVQERITGGTSAHPGSHPSGPESQAQASQIITGIECDQNHGKLSLAASQKTAQEGSVCEVEPLGEGERGDLFCKDASGQGFWMENSPPSGVRISDVVLRESQVRSLIAHLTAWVHTGSFDLKGLPSSPPSSEDTELPNMAELEDWMVNLWQEIETVAGIATGYAPVYEAVTEMLDTFYSQRPAWIPGPEGHHDDNDPYVPKFQQASTTSQKGGQGA